MTYTVVNGTRDWGPFPTLSSAWRQAIRLGTGSQVWDIEREVFVDCRGNAVHESQGKLTVSALEDLVATVQHVIADTEAGKVTELTAKGAVASWVIENDISVVKVK